KEKRPRFDNQLTNDSSSLYLDTKSLFNHISEIECEIINLTILRYGGL
ncbi:15043_t:CDS:2, partial [Gigaspora margarita]